MTRSRSPRRLGWIIGASLCGLLLFVVLVKAALLGRAAQMAYQSVINFTQVARGGNLTIERFNLAQTFLQETDQALAEAETEMRFFNPFLTRIQWFPLYGPTLAAAPPLLRAGRQLTQLAVQGFTVAKPLLVAPAGTSPLTRLPDLLKTAKPELAALTQKADVLHHDLDQISPDNLLTVVADPVAELQAVVALLASGLHVSDSLPTLLGAEQEQNYLVLVQNNHELRGTGGFVTAIGELTLQQGKVTNFDFVDSYAIDPTNALDANLLPRAPAPMKRYMHIDVMLLRDVNWSPDLPTTAQIARSLYAQETGKFVDGVITIDLHAVELFIGALEPLSITGSKEPLTGANVIERIKQMWAAPLQSGVKIDENLDAWWKQRKDFIPQMAQSAFARLQSGSFSYPRVAVALETALDERSVQIWSANPEIAKTLGQMNWDGGLHPTAQTDFLALVDTNMGYNKVDAIMERSVAYQVDWPAGAEKPAQATVAVTYKHPLSLANYDCDPRPHYGQSYDDMIARCYFDYVRLFAPGGSKLIGIEGVEPDSVNSQRGEAGAEFFTGHFILQPGEQKTVVFQYQLPAWIKPETYGLVMQKQAGTLPLPIQIQVAGHTLATTLQSGRLEWRPGGN